MQSGWRNDLIFASRFQAIHDPLWNMPCGAVPAARMMRSSDDGSEFLRMKPFRRALQYRTTFLTPLHRYAFHQNGTPPPGQASMAFKPASGS
jgi:hypothetical protein